MSNEPVQINRDVAGWWIVNHVDPKDRHHVADSCPLNDLQCEVDRKGIDLATARHAAEDET